VSLAADPLVSRHLNEDAVAALLDPQSYLGLAPEIAADAPGDGAPDAP
jgi:hypothetical protein